MNSLFRKLLTSQFHIFLTTIFAGLNIVIDQFFSRRISEDHFQVELTVSHAPILYILLSRVMGQMILFRPSKKQNAIQIYVLISLLILACLAGSWSYFLDLMKVSHIAGSFQYYLLYLLLGVLLGFNLLIKYIRVAVMQTQGLYYGEIVATILNVIGNVIAISCDISNEAKLMGIGLASIVSQLFASPFLLQKTGLLLRDFLSKDVWKEAKEFCLETKGIWSWDVIGNAFQVFQPFLCTCLLVQSFPDLSTAFNISLGISFLLERPFVCLSMVAAPMFEKENRADLERTVTAIAALWMVPVVLFFCSMPLSMPAIYQVHGDMILLILVFLLPIIIQPMLCFSQMRLRALRKVRFLNIIEMGSSDLAAVRLFLLLASVFSHHLVLLLICLIFFKSFKLLAIRTHNDI